MSEPRLKKCPSCLGQGHTICEFCDGWDASECGFHCDDCDGIGSHDCERCAGTGLIDLDEEEFEDAIDRIYRGGDQ